MDLPNNNDVDRRLYELFNAINSLKGTGKYGDAELEAYMYSTIAAQTNDALQSPWAPTIPAEKGRRCFHGGVPWTPLRPQDIARARRDAVLRRMRASIPRVPIARTWAPGHRGRVLVAHRALSRESCQALVAAAAQLDMVRETSRQDGAPRYQATLVKQRARCCQCYGERGPFASFEVVASTGQVETAIWSQFCVPLLEALRPIASALWAQLPAQLRQHPAIAPRLLGLEDPDPTGKLPLWSCFLRRYRAGERVDLATHFDRSTVTANVLLSAPGEDFCGGGCYILPPGDEGNEQRRRCAVPVAQGDAIVHVGALRHGALPITAGTRWILVFFFGRD